MNDIFLLQLISDLIKEDKPTIEEVRCARTIVNNLIKAQAVPTSINQATGGILDSEALAAKNDLMG